MLEEPSIEEFSLCVYLRAKNLLSILYKLISIIGFSKIEQIFQIHNK